MRRAGLLPLALVLLAGCSTTGPFVWVDDLPAAPAPAEKGYLVAPGDVVSIRVWGQEGISTRTRVRHAGSVAVPFLNDVRVAGYTPAALSAQLQTRLKDFINNPVVTVQVEESRPISVSVMGEVARQGVFTLEAGANVLHALAMAGGMTLYADPDRIFVLRQSEPPQRVRFTYEALTRNLGRASSFTLQSGDVVVVE